MTETYGRAGTVAGTGTVARRALRHGAAAGLAALALAACADDTVPAAGGPGAAADTVGRLREIPVLEVAAFPDSASAARLRDSLGTAGWPVAIVRQIAGDTLPPWRVRVAPSGDAQLAQLAGARLAQQGRRVLLTRDSAARRSPTVIVRPVNQGSRGAISRLRWTMSPSRDALLAVESATAIENEPMPDGFVLATERGSLVVQRDSVWDVAPDPEWERVAYGRAFMISGRGRDSVSIRQWGVVAGRTNLDVGLIQRASFLASSMNVVHAFAQPVVEALHADSTQASQLMWQVTAPQPLAGGWRLRWSSDGRTLAVGLAPAGAAAGRVPRDDAPAGDWVAFDVGSQLVRGSLNTRTSLETVRWTDGPVFDISVPVPASAAPIEVAGGRVETAGGWVVLTGPAAGGGRLVVGPGVALAATRSGRFVLAVVPEVNPEEGAPRVRPVVYQIGVAPTEAAGAAAPTPDGGK